MTGPRPSRDPQLAVSGGAANGPTSDTRPDGEVQAALFRILADGRPHALAALAAAAGLAPPAHGDDAVRRTLAGLVELGVPIESEGEVARSRRAVPLDAAAIAAALAAEAAAGIACFDSALPGPVVLDGPDAVRVAWATGSTNTELLRQVRGRDAAVADRPLLFAAEVQDGGRGRLGRRWRSAPGASLTVSIALPVGRALAKLDGATLVCGLAVRNALSACGVNAALKWPNDVLVGGRKLAGILVEAHIATPTTTVLVVGIGLNVLPLVRSEGCGDGASPIAATDLETCGATTLDRNRLAARIALALGSRLAAFATAGFEPVQVAWNAADAFAGRRVAVGDASDPAGTGIVGVARGVDRTGALLVEVDGRLQRMVAGDVSLRPLVTEHAGSTA